jgi:signal transduction histidine kinase
MPRQPTSLLPRLLADSVVPCAFAALVLTGVLTVQGMRGVADRAHMRIASQLEQLAGTLEHHAGDAVQTLLDDALHDGQGESLQRIDVEEADGTQLHSGAPADASFERYRRELADSGKYRAIVMHVDAQPRQRERQQILLYGALSELGIVALALLGGFALRHRVSMPVRRLQQTLDAVLDGDGAEFPSRAEPNLEFAQLQASATALAGLLAAHRTEWKSIQRASAVDALDQLRQSQAATRRKSQFMALVGHHFRQPMQALQLLTAGLHPGIDAEQQALLAQVRSSIATVTRLLDALLEISRLDAGVVATHIARFSATDLFLRDRALLVEEARRRQVSVVWRQSWFQFQGDAELAAALLQQLASNAIAHAGPHGRVLIAARRTRDGVRVEVRDSGPGIAAIHQQRIFEEFVQLHGDADRGEGYGLGLAIAARMAKILGTRIGVRSEPGRGSTFWFELKRPDASDLDNSGIRQELLTEQHVG